MKMIVKQENTIKYLQFENLSKFENLTHFSTTRIGGVSSGILESLNTGYTVNDIPKNVTSNLDLLSQALGFERQQMVSPKTNSQLYYWNCKIC